MIFPGSTLNVSDNSGAKKVYCIRILYSKKKYASIGNILKVSIKKCLFKGKVKKSLIYNAVLINTKYGIKRKNGIKISFNKNSVVILDKKFNIISTRIFGVVPKEFKDTFFKKIISLSKYVI
ncbi:50S ribosomal protein L14 [Candidatus Vidania fulgoroideorum]